MSATAIANTLVIAAAITLAAGIGSLAMPQALAKPVFFGVLAVIYAAGAACILLALAL